MNVAVLFGEVAFISLYKMLDGIRKSAARDNSNVVLYTCEGFLYQELEGYIAGEYNIFNLPALEKYDGVIVYLDSIQNAEIAEMVQRKIEQSGIPCVSIDKEILNADVIRFDNDNGFRTLLEHLIHEHDIRDIVFLSGPEINKDARKRIQIFKSVMTENDIVLNEDSICYGDFNFESGRKLIREYVDEGKPFPRAFVAANDFMAIGIMQELSKAGVQIPEQVVVTGYDNCDFIPFTTPQLTTIDRGDVRAGQLAYDKLVEKIAGADKSRFYAIEDKVFLGKSCGCEIDTYSMTDRDSYISLQVNMDSSLDLLKSLSISFSNIETLAEFEENMEKYISRMGMDYFYFCQCGDRESYYNDLDVWASGKQVDRDITKFQTKAWCPIAYEKGKWSSYSSFDIDNLFPPNSLYKKEGSYYIVMPVHMSDFCIGYSIIGNFSERYSGRVIQHLVLTIDHALGNIRKQDIMKTMLAKINKEWQYDELTGLYNRSGLRENSALLLERAVEQDMGVAVFFFDLDGLKATNDTLGHKAGDQYIKCMADKLMASKSEGDVVARYGGDEYIIVSTAPSKEVVQQKMDHMKSCIADAVSYSVGWSYKKITEFQELMGLIEEADKKMYEEKKRKKTFYNSIK